MLVLCIRTVIERVPDSIYKTGDPGCFGVISTPCLQRSPAQHPSPFIRITIVRRFLTLWHGPSATRSPELATGAVLTGSNVIATIHVIIVKPEVDSVLVIRAQKKYERWQTH